MLRKILAFFISVAVILLFFFLAWVERVGAVENNVFGIHISNKEDIPLAAKLVNGESGEWGYVTIVIQSDDRKIEKWQPIFYDLMEYKLQPILRIGTTAEGAAWSRPKEDDAEKWAEFLDKLYWPTSKRIVSVYNEMNHGAEWGGEVDASGYARELSKTIDKLKAKSSLFFVLNGALDQSTPQEPPKFYDEVKFLEEMEKAVPGILNRLDGWASHSYPNPGFAGQPSESGRGTIRGYKWELDLLRNRFGVTKDLPVFIKETGWVYKDEAHTKIRNDIDTVAEYTVQAFNEVWLKDSRVQAVTPFIMRYGDETFSHFGWVGMDNVETVLFKKVAELPKIKGKPEMVFDSLLQKINIPSQIPLEREMSASVVYKNVGNAIWQDNSGVRLKVDDPQKIVVRDSFMFDEKTKVMPGQSFEYRFALKDSNTKSPASLALRLTQGEGAFGEKLYVPITVFDLPKIKLSAINPLGEEVSPVIVGMQDKKGVQKVFDALTLPANGELGNFEYQGFTPGVPLQIVINSPQRDAVRMTFTPKEGVNEVQFILPPKKNALELFAQSFARALRRS